MTGGALYAGIDGGQSATTAVLGDETGRILGYGHAAAADEVGAGPQSSSLRDALQGALADALARASLDSAATFAGIVAGVSGYDGRVRGARPDLPAARFTLLHDAPIAHAGAFGGEPGIVVIAGTGSVAYGRNDRGADVTVGGWGYLFGDEGSAFWLARTALSAAMRDADAGEHNDLTPAALASFGAASLRALARAFYAGDISRSRIAAFAPQVVTAAERGDEDAAQHLCRGAAALAHIAMQAAAALGMAAPDVCFTGGLLQSATVREQIAQALRDALPSARMVMPRYDCAVGALLLAYREAGIAPRITPGAPA